MRAPRPGLLPARYRLRAHRLTCVHRQFRRRLPGPMDGSRCSPFPPAWYLAQLGTLTSLVPRSDMPGWHARSGLLDCHALDHDLLLRMAVARLAVRACCRHLLYDAQAALDRPERRVIRRQLCVLVDEEELAAVGTGPGVGHRHRAGRILRAGEVLVIELVSRSAAAGPGRIAALEHVDPRRGESVALGVVEIFLARQENK